MFAKGYLGLLRLQARERRARDVGLAAKKLSRSREFVENKGR